MRIQDATLPNALYGCANEACADVNSYPPDMLFWFSGHEDIDYEPGFYCEDCLSDELETSILDLAEPCYSLLLEMKRRTLADLMQNEDFTHDDTQAMLDAEAKAKRIGETT